MTKRRSVLVVDKHLPVGNKHNRHERKMLFWRADTELHRCSCQYGSGAAMIPVICFLYHMLCDMICGIKKSISNLLIKL
jgi:hypothetical protein